MEVKTSSLIEGKERTREKWRKRKETVNQGERKQRNRENQKTKSLTERTGI